MVGQKKDLHTYGLAVGPHGDVKMAAIAMSARYVHGYYSNVLYVCTCMCKIFFSLLQIGEYMDVDLPSSEEHPHVVRVGFSTENSSMNLG